MESLLLDNWLKNKHATVKKIYSITFVVCLHLGFYTSFSIQTYFSTANTLWQQKN